jgi:hypothetical protein
MIFVLAGAAVIAGSASLGMGLSPARAAESDSVRAACAAMGLNPSEAPFAYCVRSLAASAPAQGYAMNAPAAVSDVGGYPSTYRPGFTGTGISHNAANACAAVGIDPTTARFSYCVGNLNAALFQTQGIDTAQ